MEELKIEKKEEIKKYELPKGNIIALDENSEIRIRNEDYYNGLKEEGVEWLVEIQGSGHSDYEKKELKVWYSTGDVFVSFAINLHELGHLRQGEADERFMVKELGSPNPMKLRETELHNEIEVDAWQRGLERMKKYCPREWNEIENKFQEYKKQGKYSRFNNYEEFFKYISEVALIITRFNDEFEDNEGLSKIEKGRILGKMIKKDPLTNEFFTEQEKWRTGEKINKDFAEGFIGKAAEGIAEEEY